MALLCKPAIGLPEHVITQEDTLALARSLHADHPKLGLALRLIENAGVAQRHLVRPIEETLRHTGFTHRNKIFEEEAKKRVPAVARTALVNARLDAVDLDAVIFVSCTGFMMPSMTAWLIEELGCRPTTTQLPIAQLGCAAGAASINRAADFCATHSGGNVLVIACEFCSLCYQPDDLEVGNLLSNGLFGDAVAASVVRGDDLGTGMRLEAQGSYIIPGTQDWISYEVRHTGFHFRLNKGVPGTMREVMPELRRFVHANGEELTSLDFYAIHTGGPRVLEALHTHGGVPLGQLQESWNTLESKGNVASAAVFDVFLRFYEDQPAPGRPGLIAGFGPGITMELALGTWVSHTGPRPAAVPARKEISVGLR
ncbi:type III polyketide synthase [Lentzea sp. E54]|uniref:type III polyketide synthase n=1 Tax=Lentzea xerophila TaxID=3435883 RepID=UPI003DA4EE23